jgi:class 3 adenylate cyclase
MPTGYGLTLRDTVVDSVLGKHGGRREKHTGDGVFDGPTHACLGWSW